MSAAPHEEKQGFNFVRWSVDNPYAVLSFFAAMLVLGYLAITQIMPRRLMPYVESPILGVVTEMPGLSAKEMETYIWADRAADGQRSSRALHSLG